MSVSSAKVWGLMVWGRRVSGLGLIVKLMVNLPGLLPSPSAAIPLKSPTVWGLGFRVQVQGLGFRVSCSRFRVEMGQG